MRRTTAAFLALSLNLPATVAAPLPCQPSPAQALAALNSLRHGMHSCRAEAPHDAGPLRWDDRLAASALGYAEELAQRDTVSHEGQVLRTLSQRLRASGYAMRLGGENLAAGQSDLEDVLQQWLASPDHCANLMQPEFEDVGLACVNGPGRYQYYWVLHLGLSGPPSTRR